MNNIAIIPARSGSKGLKHKNIKLLLGKPLISYTIEAAINSNCFDTVMVSTDDEEYAKERLEHKAQNGKENYGLADDFPVELLEKKIILYGAGKYGVDLYRKIVDYKYSDILLWADTNVKAATVSGKQIEVQSPIEIAKIDFEQVVIAVMQRAVMQEIKEKLVKLGVPKEKIIWKMNEVV